MTNNTLETKLETMIKYGAEHDLGNRAWRFLCDEVESDIYGFGCFTNKECDQLVGEFTDKEWFLEFCNEITEELINRYAVDARETLLRWIDNEPEDYPDWDGGTSWQSLAKVKEFYDGEWGLDCWDDSYADYEVQCCIVDRSEELFEEISRWLVNRYHGLYIGRTKD